MKRKGFTLIELLVVIAIIAILAAILFPVFAKAREKARQTTCASNLKQLALAVIQYNQDYDERLPIVASRSCVPLNQLVAAPVQGQQAPANAIDVSCSIATNYTWGWMEAIYPYVKSKAIFDCPSDAGRTAAGEPAPAAGTAIASYGMNRFLGWYSPGSYVWGVGDPACSSFGSYFCGDLGYPSTKIQRPSDIIMITEYGQTSNASSNAGIWDFIFRYYTIGLSSPDPSYYNGVSGDYMENSTYGINTTSTHTGFTNVAFIDGHVKAVPIKGSTATQATDGVWLMAPGSQGDSSDPLLDTHWHPDK